MEDKNLAKNLELKLLKTKYPQEAAAIPREGLTSNECLVLDKCIKKEDLTDGEFALLKKVLVKYRNIVKETEGIEDNYDNAVEFIATEQEFLKVLDNQTETLTVNVPMGGKEYRMTFVVEPLTDSRAVQNLQMQLSLFDDFNDREKEIYAKSSKGNLTREEQIVYDNLNKRIADKTAAKQGEMVDTLLASQLHLEGSNAQYDERLVFWQKFPFTSKMLIFMRVQEHLGLDEVNQERFFQV